MAGFSIKGSILEQRKNLYGSISIALSFMLFAFIVAKFFLPDLGSSTFTGSETLADLNPSGATSTTMTAQWIQSVFNFNYTGNVQTWTVPATGTYKVELWGASGGKYNATAVGFGGYVAGEIRFSKDSILYAYVGGEGKNNGIQNNVTPGGWNGGGNSSDSRNDNVRSSSSGGGATDFRITNGTWSDDGSLRSRIIVAGGGGGNAYYTTSHTSNNSCYSGGLSGYNSTYWSGRPATHQGVGGNQTAGGQASDIHSSCTQAALSGSFGKGGNGASINDDMIGGGGGGGWYGGSAGCDYGAGGGGGSSYISGHTGSAAVTSTSSSSPKSGCTTGTTSNACSLTPYLNPATNASYTFTNTLMIDGAGYKWTNTKGSLQAMPKPTGGNYSSGVGHTGNGYARITYLGN